MVIHGLRTCDNCPYQIITKLSVKSATINYHTNSTLIDTDSTITCRACLERSTEATHTRQNQILTNLLNYLIRLLLTVTFGIQHYGCFVLSTIDIEQNYSLVMIQNAKYVHCATYTATKRQHIKLPVTSRSQNNLADKMLIPQLIE